MAEAAPLIVGGLLFALGLLVLRRARRQARLVRTVESLEPRPIRDVAEGLQQVEGRIAGDPLLSSPFQGRPCVYFFFRIREPREGKSPRLLASGKEWTLVKVGDETGTAVVEAWPALVASPHRFATRLEGLTTIPPDKAAFFERAGIDQKHLPRLPVMVVEEFTIEPGDRVFVTGTVRAEDGQKVFYRKSRSPLVVSAERDIGYVAGLRHEFVLYAAVSPLLLVAGAALAALALA